MNMVPMFWRKLMAMLSVMAAYVYAFVFMWPEKNLYERIRAAGSDEERERLYGKLRSMLDTPFRAVAFLFAFVGYEKDRGIKDEWKEPIRTLVDGGGDCEDWDLLIIDTILAKGDHEPRCLTCYPKEGHGHAICIYSDDGWKTVWSAGTFGVIYHGRATMKQVAEFWFRPLDSYNVYAPENGATEKIESWQAED